MEKINFEDATLKKSAYVTIGGTEYPVTDAEYVGGVDLDAATLNYAFQLMHPVGSIYMTTVETNPSEIFGFGTWELWGAGRVPVGVDTTQTEFNVVEKMDGEKTHTLTVTEMPSHTHDVKYGSSAPLGLNSGSTGYKLNYEVGGTQQIYATAVGGNQPHNNLQPYITCYMFKRTA